ncbi:MAG TPA: patatin-like phospholipase family protein [Myxococcaceae bacterium]|nr:patatin-like phospholipase family protein [Myxococcaceae bacterium]
MSSAWSVARVFLAAPLVTAVPIVFLVILLGAGRAFGLPRLFWNEGLRQQFLAGVGALLVGAEGILVVYLLEASVLFPGFDGFVRFGGVALGCWGALLLLIAVLVSTSGQRLLGAAEGPRRGARSGFVALRVAPAIHQVGPAGLTAAITAQVQVGPFLAGVLAGLAGVPAVAWVATLLPPGGVASLLRLLNRDYATLDVRVHVAAGLGAMVLFLVLALAQWVRTAAVGICSLAGLFLAVHGALGFYIRVPGIELAALELGLLAGGLIRYKLRLPELEPSYAAPVPYPPPRAEPGPAPGLLRADAGLDGPKPVPLILVATSGGGIRAAVWTAAILGQLAEIEDFVRRTRLVTGASGGMVGAAAWTSWLSMSRGSMPWRSLVAAVGTDSLTETICQLSFHDVPLAFLPVVNRHDRGQALECVWRESWPGGHPGVEGKVGLTLADLRDREAAGELPSLVFSPMLVEDGRRLLIGNRDLRPASDHRVVWASTQSGTGPVSGIASRTAVSLSDLLPDRWQSTPLTTAARLSASFPFVSPAVTLPTTPPRRVVDAGYYDNYGVELACSWLRSLCEDGDLPGRVSRALLIQIRDNVSDLSVNPDTETRAQLRGEPGPFARGVQEVTSPIEAVLAARESVNLFRDDAQLEALTQLCHLRFGRSFLLTTIFEFRGEASLSWYLAKDEMDHLLGQATSPGIRQKMAAIEAWLRA